MLSHAVLAAALPALPALVHTRGGSNKVLHLEAFFGRPLHMRSQPSLRSLQSIIFEVSWCPLRCPPARKQTAARDSSIQTEPRC